jgi:hypothetical protein
VVGDEVVGDEVGGEVVGDMVTKCTITQQCQVRLVYRYQKNEEWDHTSNNKILTRSICGRGGGFD